MHELILSQYKTLKSENLHIDLTRGKPSSSQLDLSNALLSTAVEAFSADGADIRNYGEPLGITEARQLGSELLDSPIENRCSRTVSYTHLTLPTSDLV